MKYRLTELRTAHLLVLLTVLFNAFVLAPELSIGQFRLNDTIFHYTMADRMVQAFDRGENPLDCWVSEWTLGYPVSRTYQPLGQLLPAFLYVALGRTLPLSTLFVWMHYLAIVLLPLTVYISARFLSMSPPSAAAAALISPLISTDGLFGIDYGSFVWRGSGLFTQLIAVHLLLLAVGLTFKAMQGRGKGVIAGVVLGLSFLTHFIYGYIGAVTVCLIAAIPNVLPFARRVSRLILIGMTAFAVSAFELVPAFVDSPFVNHSRWEPTWKWDSFGAAKVLNQLFKGDLMDFGRLPILSLLVLLGAATGVVHARRSSRKAGRPFPRSTAIALLAGGAMWVLLLFGRPTWGGLFTILSPPDVQLHRLIGGVHVFFILLAGAGLAAIWSALISREFALRKVVAVAATVVLLFPVIRERLEYLARNKEWGQSNLASLAAERTPVDQVATKLQSAPGRVYPGLANGWGKDFRVGYVPLYGILNTRHIPTVAYLYHAMALTSDIMVLFDEKSASHYRLFNISTVVSDGRTLPEFVHETEQVGRFHLATAPGEGYFDVVRVPYMVTANKQNFYDTNATWLQSDWVGARNHLLLDFNGIGADELPRLTVGHKLPALPPQSAAGTVLSEARVAEQYSAIVRADEPSYVLFKMTYHPNWKATVDGSAAKSVMLTPGFVGIRIGTGEHRIEMNYSPGPLKTILIFGGMAVVGLIVAVERWTRVLE